MSPSVLGNFDVSMVEHDHGNVTSLACLQERAKMCVSTTVPEVRVPICPDVFRDMGMALESCDMQATSFLFGCEVFFPDVFRELSGLFPEDFRIFSGIFPDFFRKLSGIVPEYFRICPETFRNISGIFPVFSCFFPDFFRNISGMFFV